MRRCLLIVAVACLIIGCEPKMPPVKPPAPLATDAVIAATGFYEAESPTKQKYVVSTLESSRAVKDGTFKEATTTFPEAAGVQFQTSQDGKLQKALLDFWKQKYGK